MMLMISADGMIHIWSLDGRVVQGVSNSRAFMRCDLC